MMNHFLRKSIYNIFCIVALIFSFSCHAIAINGLIKDGSIRWDNGVRVDGYLSISNWQIISGLQPTEEWKPGGILSVTGINDGKLTLKNTNGNKKIIIPFDISGVQYGLGDSGSKFEIVNSGSTSFSSCDSKLSSSKASVIGKKCASKESYKGKNGLQFTPFHFARPLISLKDSDIIDQFNDPSLTKGIYKGTVNIIPMYLFKSPTGTWTYRTATPISIDIAIKYNGSQMLGIEVIGDGIIPPKYNKEQKTVSGFTDFKVKFNGVFPEGTKINMRFLDPEGGIYNLNATDSSISEDKNKIPYGIYCHGDSCHDKEIVDYHGQMVLDDKRSYLESMSDSKEISFRLLVGYKDIPMNKVDTGKYQDSFTVMFESEM
ncbi:hypothetical protein IHC87_19950 [Photobacterium damselae subsp. damselae]|uniref:hypothetical protein n=1 Tax=Photobacterium damselae TaxID=38293 RepID=UPI001F2C1C14|nr:hypothetical protein [Photobacterium damselae]EJN6959332.1 hypothetical protein [Photobacterium damselae]EJN6961968.1 hypothetical protein [Photobacterium damselae]UJZ95713.1 hypothetical protein IHC87_19950 [Photobacterium damselae subsp. damselae]UKA00381.1 hypothetical protein IHC88_17550 [Photobacterium damselae subsp. damselae]UKA12042.1 hypothetical protein IHC91_19960 [Photobacterium damselae subsp. damselae]